MHVKYRGINDAFTGLVDILNRSQGTFGVYAPGSVNSLVPVVKRESRNGPVLVIDEPVTLTYTHPKERCLFNQARDVNPFSLLYEAIYMIAGRNDVGPLAYYTKKMADFSDDAKTLNGAYGFRWRHAKPRLTSDYQKTNHIGTDQLDILVAHLKADPTSRRAVLQHWSVEDDLLKIGKGAPAYSLDVCCNLSVMFSLREEVVKSTPLFDENNPAYRGQMDTMGRFLDITVTNRSNDLVWGCLGANFVTFSVLQEYMASRLGVEVGRYHHFSANLHAYSWNWKPDLWLADKQLDLYKFADTEHSKLTTVPLVKDPQAFERELPLLVEYYSGDEDRNNVDEPHPTEPFLRGVARQMFTAFRLHKRGLTLKAIDVASKIEADDWRTTCTAWLERRKK